MNWSISKDIGEPAGTGHDNLPPGTTQIAPGVLETRRLMIKAPLAAVVALALSKAGLCRNSIPGTARSRSAATTLPVSMPIESGQLDFEGFFQECASLAKQAVGEPGLNEDAHLYRIGAVAARLNAKTIPETKTGKFAGLNPAVNFGPVRVAPPLGVILWRLDPGAVLPPHNHTPADVLSLCLSGEARVRHFDIAGEAPPYSSRNSFIIRETRNMLLTPGRASGLTQVRDNIHTFHAGDQGAVGIDINTFLPGKKDYSFLQIADGPVDNEKRTYEAVWTKIG